MSDDDRHIERARAAVSMALVRLEPLFSSDARLTFIMRSVNNADAYMIITADDLREVEATIRRERLGTTPPDPGGEHG